MAETANRKSTQDRLLEAAGQLFAEKGFKETTVKDITEHAGANMAAVNYYFRDKERLYEEVVIYIFKYMREAFPLEKGINEDASPESRFHMLIKNLLLRFISPERPAWQGILLAQERINPNPATLQIVHEEIKKTRHLLLCSVKDLLGAGASDEQVELCHESVIGQILHQAHVRGSHAPSIIRKNAASAEDIERLARHIADFSLAGIRQVQRSAEEKGSRHGSKV